MESLWDELVEQRHLFYPHDNETIEALIEQFIKSEDGISILKSNFKGGEWHLAVNVLLRMQLEDLKIFLPELVNLACGFHGYMDKVRELITRLPRDWVVAHIEALAEPYLLPYADPKVDLGTEFEYNSLLALYVELDTGLFKRLLMRTIQHFNPAVRELGYDYLKAFPVQSE